MLLVLLIETEPDREPTVATLVQFRFTAAVPPLWAAVPLAVAGSTAMLLPVAVKFPLSVGSLLVTVALPG